MPELDCDKVLQEIKVLEEKQFILSVANSNMVKIIPGWSSFAIHGIEGDASKISIWTIWL